MPLHAEENKKKHWLDAITGRFELSNLSYESLKEELKVSLETEISNIDQSQYAWDFTASYEYDFFRIR